MSWMGGATVPLSSSSSESALGLFSDLATAWFSMDPLPSPPASGCLPVISSTAASTAMDKDKTSATCHTGTTDILTHLNTFDAVSCGSCRGPKCSFDHRVGDVSVSRATLLARLKTDMIWILWKSTYSQEVYISWRFPWDHPLEQRDPAGRNNRRLFWILLLPVNISLIVLHCCYSQWSMWVEGAASLEQQQQGGLGKLHQGLGVNLELWG